MLFGRNHESARIDEILAAAVTGSSGVLVVRGEAGMGKSALLEYATKSASRMRLLRGVGVESEAELPFGALHLMLYPYLDRLDALPGPQSEALRAAFGMADGSPNRFLVGAATLSLLAELATEQPVLCLVDDMQWLDQESSDALLFAARRFHADSVATIFAVREVAVPFRTPGIEVMWLGGLPSASAEALLDERAPGLAAPVRQRVLDDAAGNPLAVIELGRVRHAAQQAARFDPAEQVGPLPVTRRVQETFRAQIAGFPDSTRLLLLAAAADGLAGVDVVLRVASALGATPKDLEPAERAGLVRLASNELTFRHPLIRAAAYQDAPHHQRIAVHRAFAGELAEGSDRRAWHLAAAAIDPDEAVAAELERTAQRAELRGGAMAVSAAYERAGRLSPDSRQRARRITKAAQAAWDAGKPDRAARLAAEATSLTEDPLLRAEAMFVRAQVEYDRTSPAADGVLALEAAELVMNLSPERAVDMFSEAVHVGRHACAYDLIRKAAPSLKLLVLSADSHLHATIAAQIAWGDLFDGKPESAVAPMRRLLALAHDDGLDYRSRVVAGLNGLMLSEDDDTVALMEALLADARASGALGWVPYILEYLALGMLLRGDFLTARLCAEEGAGLAREAGWDTEIVALEAVGVWLAAVSGDEDRCRSLAGEVGPEASQRQLATSASLTTWALGLLDLSAGRPEAALEHLEQVCSGPARYDFLVRAVPDFVEAAVRADDPERARTHFARFAHWAEQVGNPVAAALVLRCKALLESGDRADEYFSRSLALETGSYDRARTQLLYAEWLRRRRRRSEARIQLVDAESAFERIGARQWTRRVRTELAALGERPQSQTQDTALLKRLTPQEMQVVRLAAGGLSNKEIGAQLFLSPRTVGHHLYKAYPKLGVAKRIELANLEL